MITKKYLQLFGLLLCCIMLNVSCSDDNDGGSNGGEGAGKETPDYSQKVKTTVYGFITNEYNEPLSGAAVKSGEANTTTDENGYFEMKDVSVTKNMGVVIAEAANYFKGIRTWIANADSEGFVRIKLIPKTVRGTFAANQGGNVELSNGLKLAFPADVIVDESTGQAYSGNVSVSLYWINPMGENFAEEMPGDLSAINSEGYLRNLVSYGMVATELRGENNQKLQIAKDKKVQVTAPIEQEQLSSAPETMPLWLFDEAKGIWIERGEAKKEGDKYVGDFDHFSTWNLDRPYLPYTVTVKFTDENNNPIKNQMVSLQSTTSGQSFGFSAYTDANGLARIRSAATTEAVITLHSAHGCQIYSKNISMPQPSVDLGTIKIPAASLKDKEYKLSGTVVNCDNQPVTQGQVVLKVDNIRYVVPINNGNYSSVVYVCEALPDVTIKAYDHSTMQTDTVNLSGITDKNYTVDPITICDDVKYDVYIKFEVEGRTYTVQDNKNKGYYCYFWRINYGMNHSINVAYSDADTGVSIGFQWTEGAGSPVVGTYSLQSFGVSLSPDDNSSYQWPYDQGEGGSAKVTMTKYLVPEENNYDVKGTFEIKGAKNEATQKTVDVKGEFAYKGVAAPY